MAAGMILTAVAAIEIMPKPGAMITVDQPPRNIIDTVTMTDTGMTIVEATTEAMTRYHTTEEEHVAIAPAQAPAPAELLLLAESSTGPGNTTTAGIGNHSQELRIGIGLAVETTDTKTCGAQMTGLDTLKLIGTLNMTKTGTAESALLCRSGAYACRDS